MLLYVVYDKSQYEVNSWFADTLVKYASEFSESKLILVEKLNFGISNGKRFLHYEEQSLDVPDVVIMRTIFPLLSEFFENLGSKVYNSSVISKIANDKRASYNLVADSGIDVLETYFYDRNFTDNHSFKDISFPVVLKTASGHGGKEVYLIDNRPNLLDTIKFLRIDEFLLQTEAETVGQDIRVYVLGGHIFKAVKRTSKSFKSNFSLGGNAEPYELTNNEYNIVEKVISLLPKVPDFVGIDFLPTNGGFFFNEIEDVVGTRMLYSCYNIDAAKIYIDYIKNKEIN